MIDADKCRQAYDDFYHKIKAAVGYDHWCAIWRFISKRQAKTPQAPDMALIVKTLRVAQNNECGPHRPAGSSDPDSRDYDHGAFMWDFYRRAIDEAMKEQS